MYSTQSSQHNTKTVKARVSEDTGMQFTKEQSFSFQVEAQRQYVHRLKIQREKIEVLYAKYDHLLQEMKRKDQKIKQQERKMADLSSKCKQYSLMLPSVDILKKQNSELYAENQSIRFNLKGIEQSYMAALNDYKSKATLNQRQRQKVEQFNEQLAAKLRMLQQKMEHKFCVHEKDKKDWAQELQHVQRQMHDLKTKHINQISILNGQILHREEGIDILHKEIQRLKETIVYLQQSNIAQAQTNDEKIQKIHAQNKIKIKNIKQQIQQQSYNNEILTNKITSLNSQIQKSNRQNVTLRDTIAQEKGKTQQQFYQMKFAFNQQKSILRQHVMQLQSKLMKVQKQLGDSLRRQKQFMTNMKRLQQNEQVKKNLRQVQRRQLQKINRLLLLEK